MEQCTPTESTEICGPPVERKEDDDETNPQVKVVRSSKFWFEDGNVVLQAEHTQFRLHRSLLSMHCPIFKDMFACSQPENGPTVDGCPLIHFSETLEDVKNFVKILYKSIKTYNRSYSVTVSLLRTMLHFGRKYEMKRLQQEAVYCLVLEFPSSLRRWSLLVSGNVIEGINSEEEIPMTSLFEILYLAYEHSITSILPAIYMRICLTHNAQEITEGFQCAKKSPPNNDRLLINCLLGRERLHRSVSSVTLTWLYDNTQSSSDCQSKHSCQRKRSTLITKLWNNDIQFSLKFALHPWEDLNLGELEGLCSFCSKTAQEAYLKGRNINWDELETYFGLCDLDSEDELVWEESSSDSDSDSSQSESDASAEVDDKAGL